VTWDADQRKAQDRLKRVLQYAKFLSFDLVRRGKPSAPTGRENKTGGPRRARSATLEKHA
jgi:hypothetical protein